MTIAPYIDHTNLKATATPSDIKKLCQEAMEYHFYAVCVNGCYVSLAKEALQNSNVKVAAVIGFPLGAMSTEAKIFEAKDCVKNGADEIDMVINIGWLKAKKNDAVRDEIKALKKAIGGTILKVIIETCYLTDAEKEIACTLSMEANADFVKTSTGFGTGGATLEDVQLMKRVVGDKAKIKASGGIKDKATALQYIELGVSRIGTSSGPTLL
ncbi:deoxyribose-phosphate aldolase [Flagellimonas zhangzhouensis]|uniref:Deoxyribose-phosphate aldolase n=1 Tax=Flagellimonas zhangzhouensis TaxID=1073328 RepID=A0A1H2Z831_9FLAO|nr:deoxyribose-phosphate aldolase [Allomuricauda zhangzhouensis]SDR07367.1 deoxyribose-phosphate aldolase [Allomuricauda zhangzhouensis]SDX13138.1 deoxyribose-phosphate aldolase [Allomuricauda zhangzhouensis]